MVLLVRPCLPYRLTAPLPPHTNSTHCCCCCFSSDAFDADEYFGRATADHHDDIAARTEYDDPDPHAPDPLAPSSHARDHVGVDDDARYDRGRDGGDDFDDEDEDEDDGGL